MFVEQRISKSWLLSWIESIKRQKNEIHVFYFSEVLFQSKTLVLLVFVHKVCLQNLMRRFSGWQNGLKIIFFRILNLLSGFVLMIITSLLGLFSSLLEFYGKSTKKRNSWIHWIVCKQNGLYIYIYIYIYIVLFNIQNYKLQIKSKWTNPRKFVAPSPTPRFCSYLGSIRITRDNSPQTYIYIYIYIYIYNLWVNSFW